MGLELTKLDGDNYTFVIKDNTYGDLKVFGSFDGFKRTVNDFFNRRIKDCFSESELIDFWEWNEAFMDEDTYLEDIKKIRKEFVEHNNEEKK